MKLSLTKPKIAEVLASMQNRYLLAEEGTRFDLSTLRLDDLQLDGLAIFQDKQSYCFTSDSVLLANFAVAKKSDTVVDLCSGSGIVGILVAHKTKCRQVVLVEMQEKLAMLSQKTVVYNNQTETIRVLNTKVQNLPQFFKHGSIDTVVCNPPYQKLSASFLAKQPEIAIAKQEVELQLGELVLKIKFLLKEGGKCYICHDAGRSAELLSALKANGLEPKRIFFTYPALNKPASTVFVEATKGGKEGLRVLPPVIANDNDGNYLPTLQKLFKGE